MLDYGSLFSGLETAAVAWHPLGWSTRFVSEVDATACAVLEERLPHVPNLGDVTAIDFDFRAVAAGSVDVVIGGSPCQSFSFAGDRSGLQDPRGMLALRYTEIIDATDPAVCVWENVEGALSTEGGRGFGALLGALSGHGGPLQPPTGSGWTDFGWVHGPRRNLAWRILDGRFFGLASRRRRVVLVGSSRPDVDPYRILAGARDVASGGRQGLPTEPKPGKTAAERADSIPWSRSRRHGSIICAALPMPLRELVDGDVYGISDSQTWGLNLMPTLMAKKTAGGQENFVLYRRGDGAMICRKTLAKEEERLHGLPDGWTDVPIVHRNGRRTRTSESSRSKLVGNSMQVPVFRWLGRRIEAALVEAWRGSRRSEDVRRLARWEEDRECFEVGERPEPEQPFDPRRFTLGRPAA